MSIRIRIRQILKVDQFLKSKFTFVECWFWSASSHYYLFYHSLWYCCCMVYVSHV